MFYIKFTLAFIIATLIVIPLLLISSFTIILGLVLYPVICYLVYQYIQGKRNRQIIAEGKQRFIKLKQILFALFIASILSFPFFLFQNDNMTRGGFLVFFLICLLEIKRSQGMDYGKIINKLLKKVKNLLFSNKEEQ